MGSKNLVYNLKVPETEMDKYDRKAFTKQQFVEAVIAKLDPAISNDPSHIKHFEGVYDILSQSMGGQSWNLNGFEIS